MDVEPKLESHSIQLAGHEVEGDPLYGDFMRYGRQSSAYFLFQDGVQCYRSSGGGRVHFAPCKTPFGDVNLVFTDPLCAVQDMSALLHEFDQAQAVPNLYVSVSAQVADPLRQQGYAINQIGTESRINLADFYLHGKKKKQLRHASHFGERNQCVVEELSWNQVDEAQIKAISLAWLRSKGVHNRELKYATRPPVFDDEWKVRKFFCKHQGDIVGYVFFDPYYDAGQLRGYCANILRAKPEKACNGALDFTVLEAIKIFQKEGVPELSLGVAPFSNIRPDPDERRVIRWISQSMYDYGNRLYSFKGLAYHKSRYRPYLTPWYLCTPRSTSLLRSYWALMFGLKVLGGREL